MVSFPFSLVITVLHFLHCILPLGEGRLLEVKGINCMSTNMAIKELESTKGGPEGKSTKLYNNVGCYFSGPDGWA